jgi:uncharacterized DUF497 family protein
VAFEWDEDKARTNARKHWVEFADAVAVFEDASAVTIPDEDSEDEKRWLTIGLDVFGRLLVVAYTWRGTEIRLISARKATRRERKDYEGWKMRREYDFSKGKRGPVIPPDPDKIRITIRLDEDVIAWFREQVNAAGGGNYQTLINKALREYIAKRTDPLEKTLRRVIREELRKKGAA